MKTFKIILAIAISTACFVAGWDVSGYLTSGMATFFLMSK